MGGSGGWKHSAALPQGGAANLGCSRLSSRLVWIERPGRNRLESRLQERLPAPQFVAAGKERRFSSTGRTTVTQNCGTLPDARASNSEFCTNKANLLDFARTKPFVRQVGSAAGCFHGEYTARVQAFCLPFAASGSF
jgi:hypothetical protein